MDVESEPHKRHRYPLVPSDVKGDEIELIAPIPAKPVHRGPVAGDETQLHRPQDLGRYGCYGCHDIPNFENARPIGTTLQDWGRKDTSRLAPEHIEEYLKSTKRPTA